jgi:hypothetical protein
MVLLHAARQEAKPLSHAHVISRAFCEKIISAGFPAKTQAEVLMADKAQLSAAVCTAVVQLDH